MNIVLIVLGVLLLIGLVIAHEFGHFIAARRAGIDVEEFGIGFPPRAWSKKLKSGLLFTINWLPLGGFVRLKGEHDSDTEKGSFGAARLRDKVKVMVAGVAVNYLVAVLLLTIIAFFGLPKVLDNQFSVDRNMTVVTSDVVVALVSENSPAEKAGIQVEDIIRSFVDTSCADNPNCLYSVTSSDELRAATEKLAGKEIIISYNREDVENEMQTKTTLLTKEEVEESRKMDTPKGYLGVVPSDYVVQSYTWSAPVVAVGFSVQIVQETLTQFGRIIGDLFQGNTETAKDNVTGVVGIGYLLGQLADQGLLSILFLTAMISLSLAIMNALPIPALDGGRLFVTLLFRALRRPLSKETEERIHGTGFVLLMVLFVLITILDVQRFN